MCRLNSPCAPSPRRRWKESGRFDRAVESALMRILAAQSGREHWRASFLLSRAPLDSAFARGGSTAAGLQLDRCEIRVVQVMCIDGLIRRERVAEAVVANNGWWFPLAMRSCFSKVLPLSDCDRSATSFSYAILFCNLHSLSPAVTSVLRMHFPRLHCCSSSTTRA
ncbi:hypothetical protein CERZMDRAFT_113835 [Cercospora zeae-maydis SCOH1-5]|uniref:Uncharacterized protein n=1 Tax=Cercospora zeae-maydis SCOH1-5 TaxID=717836 RepID=A0A6A6F6R3_9PEZI|nr:hypothetical protein CERZMDRAFT_113835 [Cercospora zeae-maydis SCOH1-5]